MRPEHTLILLISGSTTWEPVLNTECSTSGCISEFRSEGSTYNAYWAAGPCAASLSRLDALSQATCDGNVHSHAVARLTTAPACLTGPLGPSGTARSAGLCKDTTAFIAARRPKAPPADIMPPIDNYWKGPDGSWLRCKDAHCALLKEAPGECLANTGRPDHLMPVLGTGNHDPEGEVWSSAEARDILTIGAFSEICVRFTLMNSSELGCPPLLRDLYNERYTVFGGTPRLPNGDDMANWACQPATQLLMEEVEQLRGLECVGIISSSR